MTDREEYTTDTWKAYDADNDGMWSQTEAGVWEDSRIRSGGEVSQQALPSGLTEWQEAAARGARRHGTI
jgi:hypothetical protein